MSYDDDDDGDVDGFLGGGGAALKFGEIGTTHTITITQKPIVEQMRDFDDDEPLTWPNGKPKNQLIVFGDVAEDEREDDEDDGDRRLFVKGGMVKALRDAMRKTKGPKKLLMGGRLTMAYVADGAKTKPKHKPPKIYAAVWVPPAGAGASSTKDEEEFISGGSDDDDEPSGSAPLTQSVKDSTKKVKANAAAARKAADESDGEPPF